MSIKPGVYEPPCSAVGAPLDQGETLAPGVLGYAVEHDGRIYIPVIAAVTEGVGDVGRFLDSLSARCVIPTVTNQRLVGMLLRRGWTHAVERSDEGELHVVWVRE